MSLCVKMGFEERLKERERERECLRINENSPTVHICVTANL